MVTTVPRFLAAFAVFAAISLFLLSQGHLAEGVGVQPGDQQSSPVESALNLVDADAKIQSQTLGTPDINGQCLNPPPTEIPVNTNVTVCVRKVIHNNGPTSPVDITLTKTSAFIPQLGQPANECTITPSGTSQITFNNVNASVSVIRNENFVISCNKPSFHRFRITNTVQPEGATDPTPGNNTVVSDLDVGVTAEADFSIVSQELRDSDCASPPPTTIPVNTDIDLCLVKTVHNNGPFSPSNIDIFLRATAPTDCTAVPFTDTQGAQLTTSVNYTLNEFYTINCSEPSSHDFLFENFTDPSDPHVTDPDPSNNDAGIPYTVVVLANVDVKVQTQSASGPASVAPGDPFQITIDKTLHNNGGASPVNVSISQQVNPPPDCNVTPAGGNPTSATLTVSVSQMVSEVFDVTCSTPSLHQFSITNCIQPTDLHVGDDSQANNCQTSLHSVLIEAEADVKVEAQTLSGPPTANVGEPFTLTLEKTLHNNGGFGPAPVDITITHLSPPPDCNIVPDPQNPDDAELAVSVPETVTEEFTVTCDNPSFHDFSIENCIESSNIHIDDPDLGNNCKISNIQVPLYAQADVKITSQVLSDPPPAINTLAIDTDTSGNSAGSLALPAQSCSTTSTGSTIEIDVTADAIPAFDGIAGGISGFDIDLIYDAARLQVTGVDNEQVLTLNSGASVTDSSVFDNPGAPEDTDGSFHVVANDSAGSPTYAGPGVLSRITLQATGSGLASLSVANIAISDGLGQSFTVGSAPTAKLAINTFCPPSGSGQSTVNVDLVAVDMDASDNPHDTVLIATAAAGATTFSVADTTGFPASGLLRVQNASGSGVEYVTYTGKTATTFTGLTRGVNGSSAASRPAFTTTVIGGLPTAVGHDIVPTVEQCVSINPANVGDLVDVDVVAKDIPDDRGMAGVQYTLNYPPASVQVSAQNLNVALISFDNDSGTAYTGDSVPDTDGAFGWVHSDLSGPPGIDTPPFDQGNTDSSETGPGVLGRQTIEVLDATPALVPLTLSAVTMGGDNLLGVPILALQDGTLAINMDCPAPPANTQLSIDKTDSPDPVEPGANITYTITVQITGDPATNLVISDPLPAGTTFVSDSCDTVPASGELNGSVSLGVWSITVAGPISGTFVCTLVVQVDGGAADGTLIVNTAEVSSDGVPAEDDQTITTVFSLPPLTFNAGDTFLLKLDKILHNNGPSIGSVDVNIVQNLTAPDDCTVTPSGQNPTTATLATSVQESVQETWSVSCSDPSFHHFEVENCISFSGLHITDPEPDNNCVTSEITAVILGQTDAKIQSQTVSGPPSPPTVNQPFTLTVDKTLHNNGPLDEVDVDIDVTTVTVPPDCNVVPDPQNPASATLEMSTSVMVDENFTVTCSDPSFHMFEFENCITVTTFHMTDSDTGNNCQTSEITVPVVAVADLQIVSQTLHSADCSSPPPATITLNTDVTLCLKKTVHNAGPYGPVAATLDIDATAPPGCTVNPPTAAPALSPLAVSVNQTVQEMFVINCSVGGMHTFQFENTLTATDQHIIDPQQNNNEATTSEDIRTMEADIKITAVDVDCPDTALTNTPFDCDVHVSVHNNGPEPVVDADVEVELVPPFDCVLLAPPTSQTQQVTLPLSSTQVVDYTWEVECDDYSFHMFTALAEATPVEPTFDPDLSNNDGMGQDTIAISGPTDLKVTAVTVTTTPATPSPNVPFSVEVALSIHNNGPLTPVKVEGGAGLAVTADCTRIPGPSQMFDETPVPSSTTVVVSKTWQVTCTASGAHQLLGCGRVGPDELHVSEGQPNNNFKSSLVTVNIGGSSPTYFLGSSCAVPGDPPETCGNGIDDDGDTLIDEDPDTDGDGANDCDDLDDDGDGFTDVVEDYIGTDPLNHCARGPFDNAWPADINNDRTINVFDVLAMKPHFGASDGDGNYSRRVDLNGDGSIDIVDILVLKPIFGNTCVA